MSTQIKKNGNWVTVAGGTRMWVGTKAALQAALNAGELADGTAVMVTDDYDDFNDSDVPFTYYEPTPATGSYSQSDCWYVRKGNVVTVNIGIVGFASFGDGVFTLPAELRPTKGRVFTQAGGNAEGCCGHGIIYSDGSIIISNINGKVGFFATWTYCVD